MKTKFNFTQLFQNQPNAMSYDTYWGDLKGLIENCYDQAEEYGMTEEELESIDYEAWLKDVAELYQSEVGALANKILSKWGIILSGFNFDRPRFYNYRGDEIECTAMFDSVHMEIMLEDLRPEIENYIQNIREKSRDGYCSFEPNALEAIELSEGASLYTVLHAIFDKENAWEDLLEAHNGLLEYMQGNGYTPDAYITLKEPAKTLTTA